MICVRLCNHKLNKRSVISVNYIVLDGEFFPILLGYSGKQDENMSFWSVKMLKATKVEKFYCVGCVDIWDYWSQFLIHMFCGVHVKTNEW